MLSNSDKIGATDFDFNDLEQNEININNNRSDNDDSDFGETSSDENILDILDAEFQHLQVKKFE